MGNTFSLNNSNFAQKKGVDLSYTQSDRDYHIKLSGKTTNTDIELMITYDNNTTWHSLSIIDNLFEQELWLTEGIGEYNVFIMIHERDNYYSYGPGFIINVTSSPNRFLYPSKDVESDHPEIIALSKKITKGLKTDREKANSISDWIIYNTRYDFLKYFKQRRKDFSDPYGALYTLRKWAGVC